MIIRYGVSKQVREPHKRKRVICENHSINFPNLKPSDFDDILVRDRVRTEILANHPGWILIGYSLFN